MTTPNLGAAPTGRRKWVLPTVLGTVTAAGAGAAFLWWRASRLGPPMPAEYAARVGVPAGYRPVLMDKLVDGQRVYRIDSPDGRQFRVRIEQSGAWHID